MKRERALGDDSVFEYCFPNEMNKDEGRDKDR